MLAATLRVFDRAVSVDWDFVAARWVKETEIRTEQPKEPDAELPYKVLSKHQLRSVAIGTIGGIRGKTKGCRGAVLWGAVQCSAVLCCV